MSGNYKGLDISYCQKGMSWDQVVNDGYKFVIIRAGNDMNTRIDTQLKNHMEAAISHNIPIGVYWFALANTPEQAATEAAWCIEAIAPYKNKIRLPVYYDMEVTDVLKGSHASAIADTFRQKIQAAGYRTGLYCSTGWISYINQAVVNMFDSVWIAEWSAKCNYKGKYDIWQNGQTPRIGPVVADLDIMYNYIIAPDGNDIVREILEHIKTIDSSTDTIKQILKGMIK